MALVTLKSQGDTKEGHRKAPSRSQGVLWGASCVRSCDRCFWCSCQVSLFDEARCRVPIKADIVEGIKRKPPQNGALCSNRHAGDRADKLNAVTFFQLWCWSCHMVGCSINDAP